MTSFRVRPPIDKTPPEYTVEWYSAYIGEGMWMVLKNGREHSFHTFRWQARREARRLTKAAA